MIVWLASYPRSGNTLLRLILSQVFGVQTWSIYDDPNDIAPRAELSQLIGHRTHGQTAADFVFEAHRASQLFLVKTHEPPPDDAPAIYVIRDGRAATVSHWHYWNEIYGEPVTLEQIVLGDMFAGAWSDHALAWQPRERVNTLFLRYEEIVNIDSDTIEKLGNLLQLKPIAAMKVHFAELHRLYPQFFRAGSNSANIAELNARCPELFWLRNGEAMKSLGYAADDPFATLPMAQRLRLCDEIVRLRKM